MTKFLKNADVTGYISQTSVTSSLLKTDSAGKLVAAVAGTDYATPGTIASADKLIREVYNKTGATLTKGTVVYINDGQGNLPTVTKAIATGDSTSAQTFGVVQADITNNNNGYVVVTGGLDNMNTNGLGVGTQLYLSSTTAGAYTTTKQYAPAHLVYVGVVVRDHPTQGIIEVRIQNGYEMDELHNVSAQAPSNNDGLFWEASTSLWKTKSIPTILGYTPANAATTLTINGTAYDLSANRSWTIAPGSSARTENIFTATSGQTTFTIAGGYTAGLVDVYVNGVKLLPADFTATNGTTVVLATGAVLNDSVTIINYTAIITALPTSRDVFDYTATSGQTAFTVSGGYAVGLLDVFVNGVKLTSSEYTATNGTSFTLAVASVLSDQVQAIRYNSSITGISGSGTANYLPKFTASGTIGNSAITDNGTTVSLVSRALSGTSATFTSTLTANDATINGGILLISSSAGGADLLMNRTNTSNGSGIILLTDAVEKWNIGLRSAGTTDNFFIYNSNLTANSLTINSSNNAVTLAGALSGTSATFSGEIQTTQGIYINRASLPYIQFAQSGTAFGQIRGNGTTFGLTDANGTTYYLGLNASTGAATFSSSVTTGGDVDISTGAYRSQGEIVMRRSGNEIRMGSGGASDYLVYYAGATERMRITSSGNFGIGTTAPTSYGSSYTTLDVYNGTGGGYILARSANVTLQLGTETTVAWIGTTSGHPVLFQTNGSERMRITSGGYLKASNSGTYISTTGNYHELYQNANDEPIARLTNSNATLPIGISLLFNGASPNNASTSYFIRATDSTTHKFYVWSNGNVQNSNNSYGAISDIKLKENITDASSKLSDLLKVKIRNYNLIGDSNKQLGVIAQELEEVFPSMIDISPDRDVDGNDLGTVTKSVKYSVFVPMLIKAVQELKAELDTLKNK